MKTKFAFILVFLSLFVLFPSFASAAGQMANFLLTPNKANVASGETLELTVKLNTGLGNNVNSYHVNLTYPEDQLTFESVNTEGSPFNMALEAKGGNGTVSIIRGSTTSQTGEVLVGTVKFKAKSAANADTVKVAANDSAIVKNPDNINILEGSTIQNNNPGIPVPSDHQPEKPSFSFSNFFSKIAGFFSSFFQK